MTTVESDSTGTAVVVELSARGARNTRWRDNLRVVLSQRSAQVGLAILAFLVFVAIFADVLAPYDPFDNLNAAGEPGRRADPCIHLLGCPADQAQTYLGTDGNSRDIFSRVVHGARYSLPIGPIVVGIAILIGAMIGSISGFLGGATDNVLMRLMDIVLAFPALILAIAIVTLLTGIDLRGPGWLSLIWPVLAVVIVSIPLYARLTRSAVLQTREQDYVTASRALGESNAGILRRRILPNSITPLIVAGSLGIATAVLEVAALSFLGLGIPEPYPEWGAMIGRDFNSIFSKPLLVIAPAFMLTLTVLAFNLIGDGLRDAFDPRLNR